MVKVGRFSILTVTITYVALLLAMSTSPTASAAVSGLNADEQKSCYSKYHGKTTKSSDGKTSTDTEFEASCSTQSSKVGICYLKDYKGPTAITPQTRSGGPYSATIECITPGSAYASYDNKNLAIDGATRDKLCEWSKNGSRSAFNTCYTDVEKAQAACKVSGTGTAQVASNPSRNSVDCLLKSLQENTTVKPSGGWKKNLVEAATKQGDKAGKDWEKDKAAIEEAINNSSADALAAQSADDISSGIQCDVKDAGFGGGMLVDYIICPAINTLFQSVRAVANVLITNQLVTDPLMTGGRPPSGDDNMSGVYAAWRAFRDLANIFLVVAFLLLIFSQATSYGISAYGIKKLLPRIVIAAVLINLSYFICALLVDIFNIAGGTIGETMMKVINDSMTVQNATFSSGMSEAVKTMFGVMGVISFPALLLIIPILLLLLFLSALFSIFFIFIRRIVIIILIITAPLAFGAWILPNTETRFKKWWSMFIKMQALYPIVAIMQVISYILLIAIGSIY